MQILLNTLRKIFVAAALAAGCLLAVSTAAPAQQVVAFVNGQPITNLDVEHRAKFIQLSTKKPASRKEALDSLIDEILEVNEAKRFSIEVPDSEIDANYAGVATRMGIDAAKLTQLLVAGGASDDTLKRRLRAQLVWTNLVRGRYKSSLEIRDKDVEAQLQQKPEKAKNDLAQRRQTVRRIRHDTGTDARLSAIASRAASRSAATRLVASAVPVPAISNAVP